MAMTLRLDEATSARLRELSRALGRSQQQLVHEAVREYVAQTSATLEATRASWREAVRRARVARRPPAPSQRDIPLRLAPPPERDPQYQAWIDSGLIEPATTPLRHPRVLMPSPPGGILSYLDREDRL